jgi:hypothetical protein
MDAPEFFSFRGCATSDDGFEFPTHMQIAKIGAAAKQGLRKRRRGRGWLANRPLIPILAPSFPFRLSPGP